MANTESKQQVPVSMLKLAHPNSDYGDCCAKCGKRDAKFGLFVDTEQGMFPIGTSCAKKLAKLGYEITKAEDVA